MSKKKPAPQPNPKHSLSPELASRRDAVFDALAMLKVTDVHVEWSGGGDSGQVDCVTAKDTKQDIEIDLEKTQAITVTKIVEESVDTGRKKKDGTPIYINVKKTVQEAVNLEQEISSFTEDLWDYFGQGGWYNNDGGHGNMQIDVKAREMKFEHYNYVTESNLDVEATL